ncbi:MAG: succinate dehydrogenase, cytochrome b556 subunit [Gammaproteobacteria bacterium]|nr:MAG: succinate dehydrogenase, cytochrome b556 subunit [Gammaproteobacteria bacterium]
MEDKRPVNLDLTTIKLPLPGFASIIHRVTGFAIFLALPILLWVLDQSLMNEGSFDALQETLNGFLVKLILFAILAGLIFHLVAGVKHLLMDAGIGETLEGARRGAGITIVLSGLLILIAGAWLWLPM